MPESFFLAVEKFVKTGSIKVNNKKLAIVKPQPSEVEYPDSSSSSDGSPDDSKTKGPISPASDSGDETKPENIPLPDEGTDNSESENCPVKHQQEETTNSEPKEKLTNDETKSSSGTASTLDENADENSALKDVERKSIETPVLSDESPYSPVGKRDGERDASSLDNRGRDESLDEKIRSTEIVDDKDKEVKSFKEFDTTTTESEADKKTKCFDKTNEDRENEEIDQGIKDHEFEKIGLTDECLGETDPAVRSPDSYVVTSTSNEKGVKNVVENESFEEVTPQDFTHEKNDGNILEKSRYLINNGSGDNKLNEPLDDLTNELEKLNLNTEEESSEGRSGTVMVSEISEELKETVEMFLESKKKGGGEILNFDFDPKKRRAIVTFQDKNGMFTIVFLYLMIPNGDEFFWLYHTSHLGCFHQ